MKKIRVECECDHAATRIVPITTRASVRLSGFCERAASGMGYVAIVKVPQQGIIRAYGTTHGEAISRALARVSLLGA